MSDGIPQAMGWISETSQHLLPNVSWHAGVASIAIFVIALLVGQLVRNPCARIRFDDGDEESN